MADDIQYFGHDSNKALFDLGVSDLNWNDNLVQLPSSIKIVNLPSKLQYKDGQAINIDGAVVKAYNSDETIWTSEDYPDGIIPNEELHIQPPNAEYISSGIYEKDGIKCLAITIDVPCSDYYSRGYIGSYPIGEYDAAGLGHVYNIITAQHPMVVYVTKYDDNGTIKITYTTDANYGSESESRPSTYIAKNEDGTQGKGANPFFANTGGENYIFKRSSYYDNPQGYNHIFDKIPMSSVDPINKSFSGATAASTSQEIQLSWNRPGDGVALTDTFDITVSEMILPTLIKMTTLPTNISYADNETINLTGAVVKAYTDEDTIWEDENYPGGIIPLTELTTVPTAADQSQASERTATSDLDTGVWPKPMPIGTSYVASSTSFTYDVVVTPYQGNVTFTGCLQPGQHIGYVFLAASADSNASVDWLGSTLSLSDHYTYDNRTVYWVSRGGSGQSFDIDQCDPNANPDGTIQTSSLSWSEKANIAWTMIYGDISDSTETIQVNWRRPVDGTVLSIIFDIILN